MEHAHLSETSTYLFYFAKVTYVIKRFRVRDGVSKNNSMCSFIVSLRNVSISLLPSGVPNLELEPVVIDCDCLDLEIDTNRCHVALFELIVAKSNQNVSLSHPAVSDYYQF